MKATGTIQRENERVRSNTSCTARGAFSREDTSRGKKTAASAARDGSEPAGQTGTAQRPRRLPDPSSPVVGLPGFQRDADASGYSSCPVRNPHRGQRESRTFPDGPVTGAWHRQIRRGAIAGRPRVERTPEADCPCVRSALSCTTFDRRWKRTGQTSGCVGATTREAARPEGRSARSQAANRDPDGVWEGRLSWIESAK